jgi:hypothetical protein
MELKVIDMTEMSFEEERDLMLEHMGRVVGIPHHIYPQTMNIAINRHLGKKYITISCKQNAKTKENQTTTYDYEVNLKRGE